MGDIHPILLDVLPCFHRFVMQAGKLRVKYLGKTEELF